MDTIKLYAVFFLLIALAGCSDEIPENQIQESQGTAPWNADGIISTNEYARSVSANNGNIVIHWKFVNDTILFGLETTTSGWTAIGFEPTNRMKDADIVLGGSVNGIPYIYDMYSTGPTGPHPPDTDLGGTFDILDFSAKEQTNGTVIEFSRKKDTKDQFDKQLMPGEEITIIWAKSDTDEPLMIHNTGKGGMKIQL